MTFIELINKLGCSDPNQFPLDELIISGQLSPEISYLIAHCFQNQPIVITRPVIELDESNQLRKGVKSSFDLFRLRDQVCILVLNRFQIESDRCRFSSVTFRTTQRAAPQWAVR
jgi:hypothetical protein